ncbi:MAG: hypothetical protein COA47_04635 [Robiginitomaculum sp.]|nr:MAG: hypothetical protein COA47_04635 [Robiginitomaculum sp.]
MFDAQPAELGTMTFRFTSIGLCLGLLACQTPAPAPLNHDYPAPPSVKRLTEAGACQGGSTLAALDLPVPAFPRRAKRQGRQGWVVVSLDVSSDGTTNNVFARRSAPPGIFDKTTVKAVGNWTFQPPQSGQLSGCLVFVSFRLGAVQIGK